LWTRRKARAKHELQPPHVYSEDSLGLYEMPHAKHSETRKRKKPQPELRQRKITSPDGQESVDEEAQDSDGEEHKEGGDKKRVRWDGAIDGKNHDENKEEDGDSVESEQVCNLDTRSFIEPNGDDSRRYAFP
jgi:hypothetical protein